MPAAGHATKISKSPGDGKGAQKSWDPVNPPPLPRKEWSLPLSERSSRFRWEAPSLKCRPNNTIPVPTESPPIDSEKVGLLWPRVPDPWTKACLNSATTLRVMTLGKAIRLRNRRAPSVPRARFTSVNTACPSPSSHGSGLGFISNFGDGAATGLKRTTSYSTPTCSRSLRVVTEVWRGDAQTRRYGAGADQLSQDG